uniref:4-hydroxy-3-methylbut-2-en-1-yl diphosphate synthase (ferredoxin), chloroplastic n=1 Tax=Tetraselmis sp. GSL018 TaxID=582737 RepID=A0A061S1H7_9CHLO
MFSTRTSGVVAMPRPFCVSPFRSRPCAAKRSAKRTVVLASDNGLILPPGQYCESTFQTMRRPTRTVWVGKVPIGSEHPIVKQTMTTTDTRDVQATVDQVMKCADAGADMVRITVQGRREAEACCEIRERLFKHNYEIPLVADIHFQPAVALRVADAFEKIRINPGNFVDGRKSFDELSLTEESMLMAKEQIREGFAPLVEKCKSLGRAMRIGTNHGSLSNRILSWYGDTPKGMVESAFEFAEICREMDYHNFLFSMKASNPVVMVQAYRLLAAEQYRSGWDYPMHLGVTEAGEGEDGRMKSAIGIGSLLLDGLGDTIRVSLTEDPELEIEPCRRLADLGTKAMEQNIGVPEFEETKRNFALFERRSGVLPEQRETDEVDFRGLLHRDGTVISAVTLEDLKRPETMYRKLGAKLVVGMPFKDIATSDTILMREVPAESDAEGRKALRRLAETGVHVLAPVEALEATPLPNSVALIPLKKYAAENKDGDMRLPEGAARFAVAIDGTETFDEIASLKGTKAVFATLEVAEDKVSRVHASRYVFEGLARCGSDIAVIHHKVFAANDDRDEIAIRGGSEVGCLLVDGLGDGVLLEHPGEDLEFMRLTTFGMLQGSRMRNTKTEYVSCPSCGRTLFDLQEVTEQIRQRTGHLPGVSIAIMGCIVNGPGEMADADFGYVGGAPGKIDLYVGKEVVQRGIPHDKATDALIQLIKDHDRWVEPEEVEELQEETVSA